MSAAYRPDQVIPEPLAGLVSEIPHWFVIGGQAVRCFAPYRPSRDADFGVASAADLDDLIAQLRRRGTVDVQERSADTVHLLWNGVKVSAVVLPRLAPHVEDRHLDVSGVLATTMHAILDRGLRRDFFDLYVMLEQQRLGIVAALAAVRQVHEGPIDDGLLLRALSYFDDAEREAPLPKEGPKDWAMVKEFFLRQVGSLLIPPRRPLVIQSETVDVRA
ncbi:MAG: nucleotidyl transferase AbiEii/AbiGii toxin family protein [Acidobacteria bacterium]|nr:nucleotidyl transferase AbiEii/AbiGii toxin family protein [Acidobacteriota bacterium]